MADTHATKWFIDSRDDPHTNEIIALEFPNAIAQKSVKCADGKSRPLWELVSHQDVARLERSQAGAQLTLFHIYKQVDGGPPERWRFTPVKHHTRKGPSKEKRRPEGSKAP